VNSLANRQARVYRYSIAKVGSAVTGISYTQAYDFTFPDASTAEHPTQVSQITTLAEGNDGTIYALGFAAPLYPADASFASGAEIITQATWATIGGAPSVSWLSTPDVALPISATVASCPADIDGDGIIGINDLSLLLSSFGLCHGQAGFRQAADLVPDRCIGLSDLAALLAQFGTACP
jgi:hypothetical protein